MHNSSFLSFSFACNVAAYVHSSCFSAGVFFFVTQVALGHCVTQLLLRLHHASHVVLEHCVKQLVLQLYLATRVDDSSGLRSRSVLFLVFQFLVCGFPEPASSSSQPQQFLGEHLRQDL